MRGQSFAGLKHEVDHHRAGLITAAALSTLLDVGRRAWHNERRQRDRDCTFRALVMVNVPLMVSPADATTWAGDCNLVTPFGDRMLRIRVELRVWRPGIRAPSPLRTVTIRTPSVSHHVDLVPPFTGFDESVEEEMIEFLEQRVGTFDLYGEIERGDAFVRYCFARIEDSQAFHSRFAAAARKARFHTAT